MVDWRMVGLTQFINACCEFLIEILYFEHTDLGFFLTILMYAKVLLVSKTSGKYLMKFNLEEV